MKSKIGLKLKSIKKNNYTRFHMPGHKGKNLVHVDWFEYDFTEIPGSDNLSNPKEVIEEALDDIAKTYSAKKSFFLVNGSTVGIISSIMSVCDPGDSFIIPRNSHRSVYSALILHRINPIYIYPTTHKEYGYGLSINPNDIDDILNKNPNCKGAIITSPTYYGTCCDIEAIVGMLKKHNKTIIVDEAHGPHFTFNNKYPMSAIEAGADIVIQSTHKILNAMTQTGILHICTDGIDQEKVSNNLNMLQTSSPSYPMMISIEEAVYNANNSKILDDVLVWHKYLEYKLKDTDYKFIDNNIIGKYNVKDFDPMKIWFKHSGIAGNTIDKFLRERYNIQVELSDSFTVLAMMGTGTRLKDIEKLVNALLEINQINIKEKKDNVLPKYPEAQVGLLPWEAQWENKKSVLLEDGIGHVCSDFIIPYPPGIPLVVPGEIITRDIIEYIKSIDRTSIIGLRQEDRINIITNRGVNKNGQIDSY